MHKVLSQLLSQPGRDVQALQVRSAVALPAVKASPAGQLAVQDVHDVWAAAVPAASTKPVAHASHVRSAVALPAVKASPPGQVKAHRVQDVWAAAVPAASTKPVAHAVQVASADTEPAVNFSPAGQTVVRTSHGP